MRYYKLTNSRYYTARDTQWGEGIIHTASGKGASLCSSDVIHVYDHPLKAVLFNPVHANFAKPILWEVKVKQVVANDGLKVGVKECQTIRQIPLPEITLTQRVAFAILVAKDCYKEASFTKWADNWLSGKDRTESAAADAARAAAAAWADAAEAAIAAARAAADAARAAAAAAARAADAADAARADAAEAARAAAAAWAARAAARSASEANRNSGKRFVALAKKALKY